MAGPPAALLFFLVGGLLWGVLAARTLLRARSGRPAPAWTRHRGDRGDRGGLRAALRPVLRLTWLRWPVGGSAEALAAGPEMRLHGLLLGVAALAGAVLTTGLVSRWGEVWPRWIPVLRGRCVPVAAAVVPGALVASLFTVAAAPMMALVIREGQLWGLFVFPLPVWGPALGAAVLGYALRRRGDAVAPGTIEGS
jgi:hypothetical protein